MMDIAQHQTQTQSNKSGDRKSDHRIKFMTSLYPLPVEEGEGEEEDFSLSSLKTPDFSLNTM